MDDDVKADLSVLDRAVKAEPTTKIYWGVVAAGATASVINWIIGLNRLGWISIFLVFMAAILFFVFAEIQKSPTPIVKWCGQLLIVLTTLAFAVFVITSFALAFTCQPQLFAYLYGVDTICQRTQKSELDRIVDDEQYGRLLGITGGGNPASLCKAEPNASVVQIFEHGWLLGRLTKNLFYAIEKLDNDAVHWTKHLDGPRSEILACTGIDSEGLLQYGFRNWYCDPLAQEIRIALGKPKTAELPIWAQFQQWPHGVLAFGLPGSDEELRKTGAFESLVGVFLDDESTKTTGVGHWLLFPFNAANTKESVYCTSLWFPARAGSDGYIVQDLPLPLEKRPNCSSKIRPKTYVDGHRMCLIFGYDYRDD